MKKHFSSNSEAFASELLENLEEMFPCYYMYCDTFLHAQIFSHIIMCYKKYEYHMNPWISPLGDELHNSVLGDLNILEITMHVVLRKYFFNIF